MNYFIFFCLAALDVLIVGVLWHNLVRGRAWKAAWESPFFDIWAVLIVSYLGMFGAVTYALGIIFTHLL